MKIRPSVSSSSLALKIKMASKPNHTKHHQQQQQAYKHKGSNSCPLCRKTFESNKALCGHMRCHPERDWRGIKPPRLSPPSNTSVTNSSSTVSEEDDDSTSKSASFNLTSLFSNWTATAKRGRRSLVKEQHAPYINGDYSRTISNKRKEEETADGDSSSNKKQKLDDVNNKVVVSADDGSGGNYSSGVGEFDLKQCNQLVLFEKNTAANDGDVDYSGLEEVKEYDEANCSSEASEFDLKQSNQLVLFKKNTAASDGDIDDSVFQELKAYHHVNSISLDLKRENQLVVEQNTATTVGEKQSNVQVVERTDIGVNRIDDKMKDWRSYLSLGFTGQKQNMIASSIRKPLPKDITGDKSFKCDTCNRCFASHQALGGHRTSHTKSLKALKDNSTCTINLSNTIHQCKKCDKTFPTGQALGGHMRFHWVSPGEEATPSSNSNLSLMTSQEQVTDVVGGGNVRNFDLNL